MYFKAPMTAQQARITAGIWIVFLFASCHRKEAATYHYPSGNAVQDYFYRRGFDFPFYCDSVKSICRAEDTMRALGRWQRERKQLAIQADSIIRSVFHTDSLLHAGIDSVSVIPASVYFIDSPVVWYRVIYREYRSNKDPQMHSTPAWQMLDSNRVMATYHNLEFLVNDDGRLEFRCDQM